MKKRVMSLLLAVAMATAVLAGCGTKSSSNEEVKKEEKQEEKVLTVASPYSIASLCPWFSDSDGDRFVMGNIYEALIESNTGSSDGVDYVPVIAESWEYTDDTTLVFHLRDDVYWQGGNDLYKEKTKLTAEDVKAAFEYVLDPKNGASVWGGNLAPLVKSIEAPDESTVVFHANYPTSILLFEISNVLVFPIKAIEENFDLTKQPVGTGAFVMSENVADDHVTLVPSPDARIKPNLDKILIKIIPDKAVASVALQNGEVDIVPQIPTEDLEKVASNKELALIPNSVGWYRYLAFNCSNDLFKDLKVRQAISMAIDFDAITETLFSNDFGAKLAINAYGGAVPPEFEGADLEAWKKVYEFNPEKAQKLLEEAGCKKNANGIYELNGKALSFSIKVPSNDQNRIKLAEMASTYLKNIGVEATAVPTEWATLTSDISTGNTEMFIFGGGSLIGGMNMLFHSEATQGTSHNVFFVDKELDKMLEEGYATIDDDKRVELLKECAMRALENKVHAGGYMEYIQVGMNRRVKDFEKSPTLSYGLCNEYRNVDVTK